MSLSPSQLATLKAHIAASGDLNVYPNNSDGNFEIARLLNLTNSPDFWVFPSTVPAADVDVAINPVEYLALNSNANTCNLYHNGIERILRNGVIRPQSVEVRTWLATLLPNATAPLSRAAVLVACTRLATRAERLFSTNGTGPGGGDGSARTSASIPAFEGSISASDVESARNLPE